MTGDKDHTDGVCLSPSGSARQRMQRYTNAGIRLELVDDRLSFFLRYTHIEPNASNTGVFEA